MSSKPTEFEIKFLSENQKLPTILDKNGQNKGLNLSKKPGELKYLASFNDNSAYSSLSYITLGLFDSLNFLGWTKKKRMFSSIIHRFSNS